MSKYHSTADPMCATYSPGKC